MRSVSRIGPALSALMFLLLWTLATGVPIAIIALGAITVIEDRFSVWWFAMGAVLLGLAQAVAPMPISRSRVEWVVMTGFGLAAGLAVVWVLIYSGAISVVLTTVLEPMVRLVDGEVTRVQMSLALLALCGGVLGLALGAAQWTAIDSPGADLSHLRRWIAGHGLAGVLAAGVGAPKFPRSEMLLPGVPWSYEMIVIAGLLYGLLTGILILALHYREENGGLTPLPKWILPWRRPSSIQKLGQPGE